MEIYETRSRNAGKHPWLLSIALLTLIVFGSLLLLQGIALALIPVLFKIPVEEIFNLILGTSSYPNARLAFLFLQGFGGGLGFLLGGYIFIKWVDGASLNWKQQFERLKFNKILLLIPLLFGFIMFNSLFIYWNEHIQLPEFLSGFEEWAMTKEEEMRVITLYLTDFANTGEFLAGLLVIGLVAGIGEEYLFRGILQPKLHRYTGNPHAGIWLAAIIFSAIHFQFYGFLPRMMLGALFGYLYYYSGSLVYPILAHILNNAFTVVAVYLNKLGLVEFEIAAPSQIEWFYVVLGLILFVVCFIAFVSTEKKPYKNGGMAKSF